ncbi:50S ribosomal protein L24 [Acholeplasma laidlawii]|nr:50S ribosomal protein L24 [Acholeplasma laidlawii]
MNIKTGDTVVVIAGGDQFAVDKKGVKTRKTGRVLKIDRVKNTVIVEGVNIVKKHQRPTSANDKGGIVEIPAPIHASNVAILDPKTNTPTRIGHRIENGVKVRYAKKSGQTLDKTAKPAKAKAEKVEKAATSSTDKPAKVTKAAKEAKPVKAVKSQKVEKNTSVQKKGASGK